MKVERNDNMNNDRVALHYVANKAGMEGTDRARI